MRQLEVGLFEHSYPIYIGGGLLASAGEYITKTCPHIKKAVVVTDRTVWELYGDTLSAALTGLPHEALILPPGEQSKDLTTFEKLLTFMADAGLTRSDLLIAFGGGVIGDLGGFAAASYMRGIDFVQIPTTLLAQVDSSVGGKTAVNLKNGKNLVGAFYQPKLVLADTDLLKTLPTRELSGGLAEVIKYGAIYSEPLFIMLESYPSLEDIHPLLPDLVYTCCALKRQAVEADERDIGERMLLNFGHTFGHAIEQMGNFSRYIHGEGVALGMVMAAKAGEVLGVTPAGTAKRIQNLCAAFELPVSHPFTVDQLLPVMTLDKKAVGHTVRLVLLHDIGSAFVKPMEPAELEPLLHQ